MSASEQAGTDGLIANASTCRICGCAQTLILFKAPAFDAPRVDFELRRCLGCGSVITYPGPPEIDLAPYYANNYYGTAARKFVGPVECLTRFAALQRARRLALLCRRSSGHDMTSRVLDVGCGRGSLLTAFHQLGWVCHGVERSDFPGEAPAGVSLHKGAIEDLALPPGSVDLAVFWHVLEHLEHPRRTLLAVHRMLRPGGLLAVAVPNFGSWQAGWQRGAWPHLDLPRHLTHFEPRTLESLMASLGLERAGREAGSFEQDVFGFVQGSMNLSGLQWNGLFHQIKAAGGRPWPLLIWALATAALLPAALVESLLARAAGRSATLIAYFRKPH